MPNLLSPLSFGGVTVRNRIVMPPMWSGQATPAGGVTDAIVEYHRLRAAAGCGLVIVEHTYVHPFGRAQSTQMGVHDAAMIPGLARLAAAIRAEGAVACLQLAHAGASTSAAVIGRRPRGPSAIRTFEPDADEPEPMTTADLDEVVDAFGKAAVRAREAGFQAVEVHAAHGYLLSEFLSPLTNHRTDEYGGSDENRSRLHVRVLREVRRCIGGDLAVLVRLGAHDETPGGLELASSCRAAARLADEGADLIDVSGGLQGSRPPGRPPGYFVPYAEAIKAAVRVPVSVAGGITEPSFADRLVREGRTDLVGIGRAMLNDADWARKAIAALS
jgi:2,4-dienoyl-CoA reductase-like NADH-dependent reductase (Old Yellow Enzyme family)